MRLLSLFTETLIHGEHLTSSLNETVNASILSDYYASGQNVARLQKTPDAGVRSWRFTLWSQSLNISEQRKDTRKADSQRFSSPCSIRSLGTGYRSAVTSPAAGPVTSSSQSPPAAPPPDPGSGSQSTPHPQHHSGQSPAH